jgi:hypothetical protein
VCLVYILVVALGGHRGVVFPPPARAAEVARVCRPAAAIMHGWLLVVGGWRRSGRSGTAREDGRAGTVGGLSRTAAMLAHASGMLHETRSRRSTEVSLEFSRANALHAASSVSPARGDARPWFVMPPCPFVGHFASTIPPHHMDLLNYAF